MQLNEVKAIVTGGASGLGFAVAKHLAANGGRVTLLDVDATKGEASARDVGNGTTGIVYDPSVQFRNGISESMAQSADRVLDRFLNRMPSITIREGTRVKIVLTGDLRLPAYDSMRKGEL